MKQLRFITLYNSWHVSWVTVRVVGLLLQNVDLGVLFSILMGLLVIHQNSDLGVCSVFWEVFYTRMLTLVFLQYLWWHLCSETAECWISRCYGFVKPEVLKENCVLHDFGCVTSGHLSISDRKACRPLFADRFLLIFTILDNGSFYPFIHLVFKTVFYKLRWCPSFFSGTSVWFWYLIYC